MNASVEQVVSALDTISLNDRSVVASVIKIQSIIRMYLVMRNILIPNAKYQTKLWRKARSWYRTGKHNECEKYQLSMIRSITSIRLLQTYDRINLESLDIVECKYPMKEIDGFEYTEDFDGLHIQCDIFTCHTIAASKSSHQFALFIEQIDCQAIDF